MAQSLEKNIDQIVKNLRQLTQIDIQNNWVYSSVDLLIGQDTNNSLIKDLNNWLPVVVNEKGYITWSKGHQVRWLVQKITIPYALKEYPLSELTLRLVLTWWAEDAQIFVDGQLVQQGDLFDSSARIILTNSAIPGEEFLSLILVVFRLQI